MNYFVKKIKGKHDFYCEQGASIEQIEQAQQILGVRFSAEYREYLRQFGAVSCGGHELTGFSADVNLDVVAVTKKNWQRTQSTRGRLYVIEEAHIDDIVIWQSPTGEIYQTGYRGEPKKIYKSLSEYVDIFEG